MEDDSDHSSVYTRASIVENCGTLDPNDEFTFCMIHGKYFIKYITCTLGQ